MYVPYPQRPHYKMSIVVRTDRTPEGLVPAIRHAVTTNGVVLFEQEDLVRFVGRDGKVLKEVKSARAGRGAGKVAFYAVKPNGHVHLYDARGR